jgi:hypothetical protein
MEVNIFEKANKVYGKIKDLDKEILEIEKFAEALLKTEKPVKFSFKASLPKDDSKESILDEDGSLKSMTTEYKPKSMFSAMFNIHDYYDTSADADKNVVEHDGSFNSRYALIFLDVLLKEKNNTRYELMNQLQELTEGK